MTVPKKKMKFTTEVPDATAVSLHMDEGDVDIVVTNKHGEEYTIAYLNCEGLTIATGLSPECGLELDNNGCIVYQEN